MFNGKTHYKWPFSIAMLVYQMVPGLLEINPLAYHSPTVFSSQVLGPADHREKVCDIFQKNNLGHSGNTPLKPGNRSA